VEKILLSPNLTQPPGKIEDGQQFDSSFDRNDPVELTLGIGRVVEGLEEGLTGMCIGEKRKVTIPPELAYGSKGVANAIPPNSTLVYNLELMALYRPPFLSRGVLDTLLTVCLLAAIPLSYFIYKKFFARYPNKEREEKLRIKKIQKVSHKIFLKLRNRKKFENAN